MSSANAKMEYAINANGELRLSGGLFDLTYPVGEYNAFEIFIHKNDNGSWVEVGYHYQSNPTGGGDAYFVASIVPSGEGEFGTEYRIRTEANWGVVGNWFGPFDAYVTTPSAAKAEMEYHINADGELELYGGLFDLMYPSGQYNAFETYIYKNDNGNWVEVGYHYESNPTGGGNAYFVGDLLPVGEVEFGTEYKMSTEANWGVVGNWFGPFEVKVTTPRQDPTVTVKDATRDVTGSNFTIDHNTDSNGTKSFSSSDTSVADIDDDGRVSINGAGTTTITFKVSQSDNYNEGSDTATLTVRDEPTISVYNATKTYGDEDFTIGYSTNSNGTKSFSSSDNNVATIDKDTGDVSIKGVGTITITFEVAQTDDYMAASDTAALTVGRADPDITFNDFTLTYSTDTVDVPYSTDSDGTATFTNDDDPSVATVTSDGVLTLLKQGGTRINLEISQSSNYNIATASAVLTVERADSDISVTPTTKTYGDEDFSIDYSTGESNGEKEFTSSDTSVATIDEDTGDVTIIGAGETEITLEVSKTGQYNEASASATLTVERATPDIEIEQNIEKTYGDDPFDIDHNTNGDGTVEFISSDEDVIEVNHNGIATVKGAGEATVTFKVHEGDNFQEGEVTTTVTVNKANPDSSLITTDLTTIDEDFQLDYHTTGDGEVTFTSSNPSLLDVSSDGLVTIIGAGVVEITMNVAAGNNFLSDSITKQVKIRCYIYVTIMAKLDTLYKQHNLPYDTLTLHFLFRDKFKELLAEAGMTEFGGEGGSEREVYEQALRETVEYFKANKGDLESLAIKPSLTTEAKISLKAMLDYILLIEQILELYRDNYNKLNAVQAINDLDDILLSWIKYNFPDDEVPDDYVYLYRWFKSFADGERNKGAKDGSTAIQNIINRMVNYFETRWGKRIVHYDEQGLFEYPEDLSYIDRIRGKKHGYVGESVEREQIEEEYGIDAKHLPFNVYEEKPKE